MKNFSLVSLFPILVAFAGCAVGPDYERPEVPAPKSDAFPGAAANPAPLAREWWKVFHDPELDSLMEAGMRSNQNLRAAVAAVRRARAQSGVADSALWPTLDAQPAFRRNHNSGTLSNTVNAPGATRNTYSVPFTLSYELDVWGRLRRLSENADEAAGASEADFGVALVTVLGDIATNYFDLRGLDAQTGVYADILPLFERQLDFTEKRKTAGLAPETDVLRARTQLESARTQLVELKRRRQNLVHALAALTGRAPDELAFATAGSSAEVPVIPAGIPSQVFSRRPDVAAAEHRLAAACAAVGVAKGDYYPKFNLTGTAGWSSVDTSRLFDWESRVWSLAPSVAIPIFRGGALDAALAQRKAEYDAALAGFRSAVLTAYRETYDSLNDLKCYAEAAASQERTLADARENARLVAIQYKSGIADFLTILDAGGTLLSNELAAAQIQNKRLDSTVLLAKALGGGWDPAAPPPFDPKEDGSATAIPVSAPGEMSVVEETSDTPPAKPVDPVSEKQ